MNTTTPSPLLRPALGIVLPLLLVVAALLPFWLYQARLPEPLAAHWGLDGRPDGAMRRAVLLALIGVLVVVPAAGMVFIARRRNAQRGDISGPLAVAGFVAGLTVTLAWMTVAANLDADSWRQAGGLSLLTAAVPVLIGAALGYGLSVLARPLESPRSAASTKPGVGLAHGARAVWIGSARSMWAKPLMIGFVLMGAVLAGVRPLAGVVVGLIGVLAGMSFTSIRVQVDRNGVRIAYGALRWPVQRVKLADIHRATAMHINPLAWGGWGYRGSLRVMRRAAVVLRGGEGMRLELSGERTLVITVDDAETAAGLINDLLAAGRQAGR